MQSHAVKTTSASWPLVSTALFMKIKVFSDIHYRYNVSYRPETLTSKKANFTHEYRTPRKQERQSTYKNTVARSCNTRQSQMKKLKVWQKFETPLDCSVSWRQWYSWFEEWPTGGSTMEECNMTVQHSVKMAAPLATCTKEEQRSVIRFLRGETHRNSTTNGSSIRWCMSVTTASVRME